MSRHGNVQALFAKPHKWTTLHKDLLRVCEAEVSSEKLVGSTYLPQDGDQGEHPYSTHLFIFV